MMTEKVSLKVLKATLGSVEERVASQLSLESVSLNLLTFDSENGRIGFSNSDKMELIRDFTGDDEVFVSVLRKVGE